MRRPSLSASASEPPFGWAIHGARRGVEVLKRMLATDPSPKVREQVIFALSQSKEPTGLAAVMDAAKNDKTPADSQQGFVLAGPESREQADAGPDQRALPSTTRNVPSRNRRSSRSSNFRKRRACRCSSTWQATTPIRRFGRKPFSGWGSRRIRGRSTFSRRC